MQTLTDEQISRFRRDGYLKYRQVISNEQINHLRDALDKVIEDELARDDTSDVPPEFAYGHDRKGQTRQGERAIHQFVNMWKVQPEYRARSWRSTILSARKEIARLQRRMPSLNRRVIEEDWDELVELARLEAEGETNLDIPPLTLTWQEVFEDEYAL